MPQQNPLINLTDEELLKKLEENNFSKPETSDNLSLENRTDTLSVFMHRYNIKSGNDPIKIQALYRLYVNLFMKEDRLIRSRFIHYLSNFIKMDRTYFYINLGESKINTVVLHELVSKRKKLKQKGHTDPLLNILKKLGISPGNNYIPLRFFWNLVNSARGRNFSYNVFKKTCLILNYTIKKTKHGMMIGVHSEQESTITEEKIKEFKEKQKIEAEISSTKTRIKFEKQI